MRRGGQPVHQQRAGGAASLWVFSKLGGAYRGHQSGRSGDPYRIHGKPHLLQGGLKPPAGEEGAVYGGVHRGQSGLSRRASLPDTAHWVKVRGIDGGCKRQVAPRSIVQLQDYGQ